MENKSKTSIYFAGSIAGGRQDAGLYQDIIKLLKSYGHVWTEHIGKANMSSHGEQDVSIEEIYTRDVDWVRQSTVFIAEATVPSLGVGYEFGLAESLKIPTLALYRPSALGNRRLSPMISGNSYNLVRAYESLDELPEIFDAFFAKV